MLSCREVNEKASTLVDGELSFTEKTAMRMHLMMCSKCRRFMTQFKTLIIALAKKTEQNDPADAEVIDRLVARLIEARLLEAKLNNKTDPP